MKMQPANLMGSILAALALFITVALQTGCVAVAVGAGAGAVAYIRGDLEATLEARLDDTNRAADRAIAQLEFAKISNRKDALSANVTARTAQDKKVQVEMTKISQRVTKVKIRIGVFGDEAVSLAILDKIRANL